ncbi:FAD-dependent monooxygenase [Candidatus Poribacteria bacterium]|nr:FAD-dependent monooxygenase [Candidatus Poribacteria bacterium]
MPNHTNQTQFDIIIIGGGLAGCTAAYHLHQLGFRVLLAEQKIYPCDKLCGEFLSPEAISSLKGMGVWEKIEALQPAIIDRVLITTQAGNCYRGEMPASGIGLSRYQLDWTLWAHCESVGVAAIQGFKVQQVAGRLGEGFKVSGGYTDRSPGTFHARLVIGAFGKRSSLERTLNRRFWRHHHGYIAFKAHFEGIDLQRWVELHSFRGGYCGLCHIELNVPTRSMRTRINLCLIVKESVFRSVGSNRQRLFDEVLCTNPVLRTRLETIHRVSPRFLSIGQIAFARKTCWESDLLMVGDSAGMIAPLCGDGMAMAMGAAERCVPLVADYLRGVISVSQLKEKYLKCWKGEFQGRLRWGKLLQFVLFRPILASSAVALLSRIPRLGQYLIEHTRDTRRC